MYIYNTAIIIYIKNLNILKNIPRIRDTLASRALGAKVGIILYIVYSYIISKLKY